MIHRGFRSGSAVVIDPPQSVFSTTFPDDENPIGADWLNGEADGLGWRNFKTIGGIACAAHTSADPTPPFDDAIAQVKSSVIALPANHYIEGIVKKVGGYNPGVTHELGLFVRFLISANSASGYEAYLNFSGNHTLVRWNGPLNDFTPLASGNISTPTTPDDLDVVRFEADGTTISFYQNGNLRTQVTDSDFATGQTGLQSFMVVGGTPESYGYYSITTGPL